MRVATGTVLTGLMVLIGSRAAPARPHVRKCICGHPETGHLEPHPVDRLSWCTWPGCGCAYLEPNNT